MVQRLCVCCRSRVRDDGQAILFTPVRRNASQHSCSIYLDGATRSTSTRCRAETEELPCHKPPHLSKSQILCCLSVNRTPIGSKELTTVHGTSGMSTHWPLSSLMHRVGDTSGIESGIELKRGKLYDRQPTGRAPLEIFSVVLIISFRMLDGDGRVVALEPLQGWRATHDANCTQGNGRARPKAEELASSPPPHEPSGTVLFRSRRACGARVGRGLGRLV